ncbi:MAG: pyridoxamine 5'-phosphate oxidase family protein [Dehalobacterium sp.]
MRRKDRQVSDKNILYKVINQAVVCRMGLVKDNHPYVIPLNFGFDEKHIYFHSATGGEKVQILKENNHVCLEFEQDISIIEGEKPCNWGMRYFTVVVHGTAELVADPVQKSYGLAQVLAHYKAGMDQCSFTEKELGSVLVYKVTPSEIIGKACGIPL